MTELPAPSVISQALAAPLATGHARRMKKARKDLCGLDAPTEQSNPNGLESQALTSRIELGRSG
jgi:hypothetical protein